MVHVSPDSRLLVSLVKQEQAYAAQLHNLLNVSGTSLSALAVYASSSPPTVSPVINGVASAFSGADEALRTYGEALNDWIDQLRAIKLKEEEVANIGRDREILVTRLLKASQKSKSPPPSLLHLAPDASSSSFHTYGSKINAAQTELQACESHLADKERELESVRIHALTHGLKLRCGALVQCGWVWGEMGRRALSMLEELDGVTPPANGHATQFFKPLPNPHDHDRDSVLSSLTPSQSASQTGFMPNSASSSSQAKSYRLSIPPPHLVSEHSAIIGEEPSTSSEEEGPVEIHDNPRFQPPPILNRQRSVKTAPSSPARASPLPFPSVSMDYTASSDVGTSKVRHGRDRKGSGIFGNIATLFRTSMTSKPAPSQSGSQWRTRTNRNVKIIKTDGEQSSGDDEEPQPKAGRLRKIKGRAATVQESKKSSLVGAGTAPLSLPPPTVVPAPKKKKKGVGERGKGGGTVRSTSSEPGYTHRVRANSVTPSSMGPVSHTEQNSTSRSASMDGRWGLAASGSPSGDSSHKTWKPPKPTKPVGDSLMSIVEGVSYAGRAYDDPSSRLEVVRAPGNRFSALPLLVHPPPLPVSISAPTTPISAPSSVSKRSSLPVPSTSTLSAAEKKPLRSAIRNPNRDRSISPSPSRSSGAVADSEQQSSIMSPLLLPGPLSTLSTPARPPSTRPEIPSTIIESPRQSVADVSAPQTNNPRQSLASMKTDDTASISSYETGHENFDNDEPETPSAPSPPSAHEKTVLNASTSLPSNSPPQPNGTTHTALDKHELSSATSTDTTPGATPSRRKSVRMSSLPPQVSATPPALDDYEDDDRSPWGKPKTRSAEVPPPRDEGWRTRIPNNITAWDDSSSEDEEYKAARRALSRVTRQS